jgi:hypothetical protein
MSIYLPFQNCHSATVLRSLDESLELLLTKVVNELLIPVVAIEEVLDAFANALH